MPRFAANLGYNPLEPLKPGTSQNQINIASNKTKGTTSNEPILAEVPAAQFDWNSSGLVNPLDGKINYFQICIHMHFSSLFTFNLYVIL